MAQTLNHRWSSLQMARRCTSNTTQALDLARPLLTLAPHPGPERPPRPCESRGGQSRRDHPSSSQSGCHSAGAGPTVSIVVCGRCETCSTLHIALQLTSTSHLGSRAPAPVQSLSCSILPQVFTSSTVQRLNVGDQLFGPLQASAMLVVQPFLDSQAKRVCAGGLRWSRWLMRESGMGCV